MSEVLLTLADTVFSRPGPPAWRLAIEELSFRPGEVVALLGATGAGKSTLLGIAAGVLSPERGAVWLGTVPLAELGRRAIARRISYMAEVFRPECELTVRQAVSLGRPARRGSEMGGGGEAADMIRQAMERARISDLASRPLTQLSRGEEQRVLLASVLVQRSQFLLLDEPDAFLDVRDRHELFRGLREQAAGGTGAVIATHDLELAGGFADRVVLLGGGEVVADGGVETVLDPGVLNQALGADLVVEQRHGTGKPLLLRRGRDAR